MPTEARKKKVRRVLSQRQPDLRVILEDVKNTHNASAVTRTCDAAGIMHIDVISDAEKPLPINEAISTRADKWVHIRYYPDPGTCFLPLKKEGFQIVATHISPDALPFNQIDFTQPTAVVFGNEAGGLSKEALAFADHRIKIPMFGMAQSLNLSVAVGIILYEAVRQRTAKGYFKKQRLKEDEYEKYYKDWLKLS
ncbi:MAG: RNA methyltransferase [Candidatus Aminicenantes bacterium]|nr:RNA methyltransferase [Candidatus Aminicenantes bacterium]